MGLNSLPPLQYPHPALGPSVTSPLPNFFWHRQFHFPNNMPVSLCVFSCRRYHCAARTRSRWCRWVVARALSAPHTELLGRALVLERLPPAATTTTTTMRILTTTSTGMVSLPRTTRSRAPSSEPAPHYAGRCPPIAAQSRRTASI